MTGYKKLLNKVLIKQFAAEPSQIEAQTLLAKRDLKTASEILDKNLDWAFNIAYNAVLQATRGLIYSEGYRLSGGEGNHKAAIQFAEIALGALKRTCPCNQCPYSSISFFLYSSVDGV